MHSHPTVGGVVRDVEPLHHRRRTVPPAAVDGPSSTIRALKIHPDRVFFPRRESSVRLAFPRSDSWELAASTTTGITSFRCVVTTVTTSFRCGEASPPQERAVEDGRRGTQPSR